MKINSSLFSLWLYLKISSGCEPLLGTSLLRESSSVFLLPLQAPMSVVKILVALSTCQKDATRWSCCKVTDAKYKCFPTCVNWPSTSADGLMWLNAEKVWLWPSNIHGQVEQWEAAAAGSGGQSVFVTELEGPAHMMPIRPAALGLECLQMPNWTDRT